MRSSLVLKNQLKNIDLINNHLELINKELSDDDLLVKYECEQSFYAFVKHAWPYVEGEHVYIDNWHIKALCDHAEECYLGNIQYLILNIPPGCMKSTLFSVMFPAWIWIKTAKSKILTIAGSKSVAYRDSAKSKDLIQSTWYQHLWGDTFYIKKNINSVSRYTNNKGGSKVTKTLMGSLTGERCNFIVIDDPNDYRNVKSEVVLNHTNNIIAGSIFSRRDGGINSSVILIMQRFHENDVSGFMLGLDLPKLVHLVLPFEFKPNRKSITVPLKQSKQPWSDPRIEKDELIWPNRFNNNYLIKLKKELQTRANIEAQLQQLPSPESGNIFLKEWFNVWKEPRLPKFDFIIQSWDTALSTEVNACESAMTTWGIFLNDSNVKNIMFLNLWTGKFEHPQLRRMIKKCQKNYFTSDINDPDRDGPAADLVLIEEASGGKALLSDLRQAGLPIMGFNPRYHGLKNQEHMTSKADRARLASMTFEQKLVWLPVKPNNPNQLIKNASIMLDSLLACPTGGNKDLIDSMSQAFIFIRKQGLLYYKGEEPEEPKMTWEDYYRMENELNQASTAYSRFK